MVEPYASRTSPEKRRRRDDTTMDTTLHREALRLVVVQMVNRHAIAFATSVTGQVSDGGDRSGRPVPPQFTGTVAVRPLGLAGLSGGLRYT